MTDGPRPRPHPSDDPEQQPVEPPAGLRRRIRTHLRDVSRDVGANVAGGGDLSSLPAHGPEVSREAEDAALMQALALGEVAALERLYDRYAALVYSVSLRILRDPQMAEDVVQEVFLRLWRQPASFDPGRGRFISWLMSVTRNRSLDEQRRVSRRQRAEDQDEDPGEDVAGGDRMDDPEVGVELAEQRAAVRAAMTRLPPAQREVIELAYFGGLTQNEIAERTGDPLGTVKTRIRLGMRKLRETLIEYLPEDGAQRA